MAQPKRSSGPGASRSYDRARYLGTSRRLMKWTAEAAAVAQFNLDQEQRRQLMVREQD
jgi:hypothetical protein